MAPWKILRGNRMIGFGLALLVLGMFILLLGFAALVNHSVLCLVHPGGGDCPVDRYQVALLAPLYPIGGEMIMIGSIILVAGSAFTVLGSQKPEKVPGISAT